MKEYVAQREAPPLDEDSEALVVKEEQKVAVPISAVCSSQTLDQFLEGPTDLNVSYNVAKNSGVDYVSEKTTGMELPENYVSQMLSLWKSPRTSIQLYSFFSLLEKLAASD